ASTPCSLAVPGTTSFPRSRERGPVEATKREPMETPLTEFPRSRERGPVEALSTTRTAGRLKLDFRAHVSAPPLTPVCDVCRLLSSFNFRAHVSAAPLKLQQPAQLLGRQLAHFRAHVSAEMSTRKAPLRSNSFSFNGAALQPRSKGYVHVH